MKLFKIMIATLLLNASQNVLANTFKTEKWLTQNGVPVVFYQAKEVPMLDISIAFAAGSAYDGEHYGLSNLTSHMLNQGSPGKDATAIAEGLADTGSQLDSETNRDMTVFNLRTLTTKDALQQSTHIFNLIINHPDFPDDAFAREKKQLLMSIEQSAESPDEVANISFFNSLYQQHPYAHPVNGFTSTVKTFTKKQVIDFYKQYYVRNNALLVMVGAIDSPKAHELAEQLTKELPKGTAAPAIPKAPQLTQAATITLPFPSSQTIIRLGQVGIDHQDPDYFPLMVGNYILGGGALVSRLSEEVREKRGLTYGINSQFSAMPGKGPFIISFSTKNDQAATALKITKDTLNLFINDGPTAKELSAAKQYLTGSFPMSLAGNRAIAGLLLRMAFYHLPDNYLDTYVSQINKVSAEEIKRAYKRLVNPDKLLLVEVGKF